MYIPFSFFGGNTCTGSGFCYVYGNTSISSADDITYTSLCGVSSKALSISPNRVEKFAAISSSVAGLAATTKLAGQPYTISSSCNLIQPTVYTITKSVSNLGTDIYYYQSDVNSNPTFFTIGIQPVGTTTSVVSIFPPQLTYRTGLAVGGISTITNVTPSGSPVVNTNWNADTVRKWSLPMMSGSFSINTSLYGVPYIRNVVIPLELDNSPGLRYEMLSETTPYIQFTTPIGNNKYLGWNYSPEPIGSIQTISSSYWNYSVSSPNQNVTINYVNCSNVSASITVTTGTTQTFCARYESIVFPSLAANTNLIIELISPGP